MAKTAFQTPSIAAEQLGSLLRQAGIVICASAVIAVCARLVLPLPFTPVPLTLANFGVLLVGLTLGSKRGFAAAALYLAWGAMGLPVFSPAGPGGIAPVTRTDGRIPVGLSRCRLYRGLDCRARCLPELHPKPGCRNCGRSGAVCRRDCVAGCLDPQLAQCGNLRAVSLPLR